MLLLTRHETHNSDIAVDVILFLQIQLLRAAVVKAQSKPEGIQSRRAKEPQGRSAGELP